MAITANRPPLPRNEALLAAEPWPRLLDSARRAMNLRDDSTGRMIERDNLLSWALTYARCAKAEAAGGRLRDHTTEYCAGMLLGVRGAAFRAEIDAAADAGKLEAYGQALVEVFSAAQRMARVGSYRRTDSGGWRIEHRVADF